MTASGNNISKFFKIQSNVQNKEKFLGIYLMDEVVDFLVVNAVLTGTCSQYMTKNTHTQLNNLRSLSW